MKAKRVLAIGLLTITAIGLVTCAIVLGKKNDAFKPKVQQTDAIGYYTIDSYNKNNNTYTILGTTNTLLESADVGYNVQTIPVGTFTIQQTTTQLIINENWNKILSKDSNNIIRSYNITRFTNKTINLSELNNKTINNISIELSEINYGQYEGEYLYQFDIYHRIKFTDNTGTGYDTYFYIDTNEENIPIHTQDVGFIYQTIEINNLITNLNYQWNTGYTTASTTTNEIVDIRGLMLNILTMPFTFITEAFNVTLWEGTPYAFNFSNFIKGMIAIAAILFIIKLFTSGFSIIGNYTASRTNTKLKKSQTELNKAKTRRTNKLADKGK